jgi:RecA-family ATPase
MPPPATSPDEYCSERDETEREDKPPQLTFLDPTQWEGRPVPQRRWLVPHRLPLANVTMLNGDGSAGKTTIALQLAVATIRGTDWLGSIVDEPGPAIFFTAEEDKDEIHRRLAAIAEHQAIGLRDLARLHILCMPGSDTVLGIPDRFGVIHATPLFESLCAAATRIRPTLIAIEAVADAFAGNENDRAQVRQFIALLRRLALTTGAAILLIAHPSLTGLATGTGTSGSTAWNNSVRSRLYFTSAKKTLDSDDAESDIRELKVMKSNYGPAGEVVRLRWKNGVFVPEGGVGTLERIATEAAIDQAYLDCLDAIHASGRQIGPYPGKAYAPTIFEKMPQAQNYRAKALGAAQERLFNAGRIEVIKIGPPSKSLDRIVRTRR